jgi:hypothetical protein
VRVGVGGRVRVRVWGRRRRLLLPFRSRDSLSCALIRRLSTGRIVTRRRRALRRDPRRELRRRRRGLSGHALRSRDRHRLRSLPGRLRLRVGLGQACSRDGRQVRRSSEPGRWQRRSFWRHRHGQAQRAAAVPDECAGLSWRLAREPDSRGQQASQHARCQVRRAGELRQPHAPLQMLVSPTAARLSLSRPFRASSWRSPASRTHFVLHGSVLEVR